MFRPVQADNAKAITEDSKDNLVDVRTGRQSSECVLQARGVRRSHRNS